ncbi:MAG TPA: hypothetical protein VFJ82_09345 [Longimicrobium sp.]|nr:hypothetical protein [Longimicrobium sp.]
MAEAKAEGDSAPVTSLVYSVMGKDEQPVHALGEYTSATYPTALADALRRRNDVAAELRAMDLGSEAGRRESLPRLVELLKTYPHPLAYEALVLAFVEQRRWDEAKGVAFAARERRWEVEHSPWPEVRSEVDRLRAWSPEDVEELRLEAIGELATPGVTRRAASASPEPVQVATDLTPALG